MIPGVTEGATNIIVTTEGESDEMETREEGEDTPKTEPEGEHEAQQKDLESEPETDEVHESDPDIQDSENQPETPASKKEENQSDTDKSAESGRWMRMKQQMKDKAKEVKEVITSAANYFMGTQMLVYEKKIPIDLPHGKGPKTYCRFIRYKPIDCKLSPEPVITLTIQPSGRCQHEDTHLFVRFAGYHFQQPDNAS